MLEIALEITICLLLAALIGFILGFIVAKMTGKKERKKEEKAELLVLEDNEEQTVEIPKSSETLEAVETLKDVDIQKEENGIKPELLDAPKNNNKDALSQIKGIGPKLEEQLNTAGIYHFEQIAQWTEENIAWLEMHTAFAHRAKKDFWVNQAKALLS